MYIRTYNTVHINGFYSSLETHNINIKEVL